MKKRSFITAVIIFVFLIFCKHSPTLARWLSERLSLPLMLFLHRLTARVPFPVAETAGVGLVAILAFSLVSALVQAAAERTPLPLRRWLAGLLACTLTLAYALALLWGPPCFAPVASTPPLDDGRLAGLCEALIDRLNASPLAFPEPSEALRLAPVVAGFGRSVKTARYPEWMNAGHAWGLYVPLTGEALVDASAPGPLIPFTAVHELAHLSGVADEGAANIAAWESCLAAGDAFADSARLWALRYALGQLGSRDPEARARLDVKMEGPLMRTFRSCGGEIQPAPQSASRPSVLRPVAGDYGDLVGYLAAKGG